MQNRFVLVRTTYAGVHTGHLVSQDGQTVVLSQARRIWRWSGANTLNEIALRGCSEDYSRISEPVPEITLTDAIEIIPTSAEAEASLVRSRWGS